MATDTEGTPKKQLYIVTQTQPAMQTWTFEVVASSEEEALNLVENGDADPVDYQIEGDYNEDEYEVIDVEDLDEEDAQ